MYKLCVLLFDIVQGSAPSYMYSVDLCNTCSDDRLHSASRMATLLCLRLMYN